MLTPYANQATKETILCLSGSKGFCEALTRSNYRNKEKADAYLKEAAESIQNALNAVCEGLDGNVLNGIVRYSNGISLKVVPKSSVTAETEEYIISRDELEVLLRHATADCAFCDLDEKETKSCPIRKALLHSLVIPADKDTLCPYRNG